jgi:ABC-type cobalamin transport system ATPase subunit
MGAAKSTPVVTSAGVVNQQVTAEVQGEKTTNYDRDEINKTVNAALAQTYEQIRSELEIGQALSLQRADQLVSRLFVIMLC